MALKRSTALPGREGKEEARFLMPRLKNAGPGQPAISMKEGLRLTYGWFKESM